MSTTPKYSRLEPGSGANQILHAANALSPSAPSTRSIPSGGRTSAAGLLPRQRLTLPCRAAGRVVRDPSPAPRRTDSPEAAALEFAARLAAGLD
jgi:hypothetical protein